MSVFTGKQSPHLLRTALCFASGCTLQIWALFSSKDRQNSYYPIRKTVKDTLCWCVTCKRYQGKCLMPPQDLLDYRVDGLHSFQTTGLDYAGPLLIKELHSNKIEKVYTYIYIVANLEHLELTHDVKFPVFIRCFKRFVPRWGIPDLIVHNNAKTFISISFKQYLLSKGIRQKFILVAYSKIRQIILKKGVR